MAYLLENLGDERFQHLCQALLTCQFPHAQCLPIGQPDGGRDGFSKRRKKDDELELIIFQVKFVKDPNSKESRSFIDEIIKKEKAKVARLRERGATSYYLITNAAGSAHLDVGSIDKANKQLEDAFGMGAACWWRDDIERRVDAHSSIKWSYPEILRATDLLEQLLGGSANAEAKRRSDAIRSYMAHQAKQDSQLKFKQIELQKTIVDLFVDVPAKLVVPPNADEGAHSAHWQDFLQRACVHPLSTPEEIDGELEHTFGALELMIKPEFVDRSPQIVVEGAPGQGKSTVTQFLCQVNRLRLLNNALELAKVAEKHRPIAAAVPFRVDLRDYAAWLSGKYPFGDSDTAASLPQGATPVLESFIAEQVHRFTGAAFSVDDLTAIAKGSRILIVLDGFDEVADIKLRGRIVEEVSEAAARINANALSSQIIVTSRPAVFANSPGFPRSEWQYIEILPLTRHVIDLYAERWLHGRGADARERHSVTSVLREKLAHSHVRDLARNPMQLAILLALIAVQGASLPDKRTELYDSYIDIFLNRESEKSEVVRDHRALLVQIHRYLAWVLHAEAEDSGAAGNIGEARLKETLRSYLEENEQPVELVGKLFTGMVERVVALVSRVQGTFEFEVQPLREYFAARHLYDTAPYAPAGKGSWGRHSRSARNAR